MRDLLTEAGEKRERERRGGGEGGRESEANITTSKLACVSLTSSSSSFAM